MQRIFAVDGIDHFLVDFDKIPGISYVRGIPGKGSLVKKTIAANLGPLPKIADDWKWDSSNILFFFYDGSVRYTTVNSSIGKILIEDGNELLLEQDETIEAKVRNRLGPITNLVALLEDGKDSFDEETLTRLIKQNLESVKDVNEKFIVLGKYCDKLINNLTKN